MGDLAVGRGREIVERLEAQGERRDGEHLSGAGDEQHRELREVLGPVGDDLGRRVVRQPRGERLGGGAARQAWRAERLGDHVEERNDVAFDPRVERSGMRDGDVEFLAAVGGDERHAEQRAAKAVELGIEEIAHPGGSGRGQCQGPVYRAQTD